MRNRLKTVIGTTLGTNWIMRVMAIPLAAAGLALLLLVAGAIFAFQVDTISRAEKLRQTMVQANVLASGIAAPLAFNDQTTLQEYIDAVHADPQIMAVGAYDAKGHFVAGYQTAPVKLPRAGYLAEPVMSARDLIVTVPIAQGGTQLGTVYLHATLDSWTKRATRYAGLVVIVLMAAVLIATLGASYASLNEAHRRLQTETASRLQAEEALRQSQKMEALGQLTGGVAHDFNNLLMVASGSLELMERTQDPAKLQRLKSAIRQAVDRGAKLTRQLLSFSRRSPLKVEVIDLGERIRGMDVLLDQLANNRIALSVRIAPGLWPVEVDTSELEVALLNIVINARDAMTEGGTIEIVAENQPGTENEGDQVRLAIADNGSGMPPEIVERIFEPFFTTKGAGHGTGLGLSQVYGFARASGGDVKVESEPGKGTTVALVIPRSLRQPARKHDAAPIAQPEANRKILLVEDNDTVAEMVGGMLDEIGFNSERVASADAALERLQQSVDFDLVLSDMIMPGSLDGAGLVREIAQRWSTLPFVLMTGYSEASTAAQREGIRVLTKPFTMQALAGQIDEAIKTG